MALRPADFQTVYGFRRLGIAISGFPEFGQFYIAGFPASTQVFLKSAASANFATPAWPFDFYVKSGCGHLRLEAPASPYLLR